MARNEDARLRFPPEFRDFLEDRKERPNQPNIEVLSNENVLDELKDRLQEFQEDKEKGEDDFGSTLNLEL